jgi:hypothetical protein
VVRTRAGGGGRGFQDYGPPSEVVEAGAFQHACEGEAVCKLINEKVWPCFFSGKILCLFSLPERS